MSEIIELTQGVWTELPINKAGLIRHKSGKGQVIYCIFPEPPSVAVKDVALIDGSVLGQKVPIDGVPDGMKVYALAFESNCFVSVTPLQPSTMPDGVNSGERAINVQFYDETNKKLGSQWEASRRVTGVGEGDKLYSVIKVGSTYPIDLKSRALGATGGGVIGRIYELFPEDIASYGTPDPWYNMRFDLADPEMSQPDTKLYVASGSGNQVTFTGGVPASTFATAARKRGADLFEEANQQNQGKGFNLKAAGSNRIIYQDKIALLEIESLDANQSVSARLEQFEGFLDLPLS